jgi:hypothetical protein
MKIRLVGAELFHANTRTDEQTDMTELIVFIRNFTKAPKKSLPLRVIENRFFCHQTRCLAKIPTVLCRYLPDLFWRDITSAQQN